MPTKTQGFPKQMRLRKRKEFLAVYRQGKRYSGTAFTFWILKRDHGAGRLGITVSRKVGKAVVRNRIKRVVREYFRHHSATFAATDVVIDAKPQAAQQLSNLHEALVADFGTVRASL